MWQAGAFGVGPACSGPASSGQSDRIASRPELIDLRVNPDQTSQMEPDYCKNENV